MKPFEQVRNLEPLIAARVRTGVSRVDAIECLKDWVVRNDEYQVIIKALREDNALLHLSIKRHDQLVPANQWRDFQEIKNLICGPEVEAIQIHPAESRVQDSANQYHLWVFNQSGFTLPWGFHEGRAVMETAIFGAMQNGSYPEVDASIVPFMEKVKRKAMHIK